MPVALLDHARGEQWAAHDVFRPGQAPLSRSAQLASAGAENQGQSEDGKGNSRVHFELHSQLSTHAHNGDDLVEAHLRFVSSEPVEAPPSMHSPPIMAGATVRGEPEEDQRLFQGTGKVYDFVQIYAWPANVARIGWNVVDVALAIDNDLDEQESCGCGEQCTNECPHFLSYTLCDETNCESLGDCGNKFVARFQLEIFVATTGAGVCCATAIPKGAFIVEYLGELIDDHELRKRTDTSYVVGLKAKGKSGESLYVDAGRFGNEARFVNHSCRPNCILDEYQWKNSVRLGIFAKQDLQPMQELTFHYHSTPLPFHCQCGQSCCVNANS
ncbi:hypothetical protein DVH05_004260 [Phytophthora capsici]|nr:hypothetical protein DVH05_004260 [Phytophthora capsici]